VLEFHDIYEPFREDGRVATYDEHVQEIAEMLIVCPPDITKMLLECVRNRVKGEMYLEVMERYAELKLAGC
jgi:hypothetical protein